jgi:excisionase family DNA binding protein
MTASGEAKMTMAAVRERRFDMTTDDAAASIGVHPETVRRWARGHRLPARKTMAGHWVFDRHDIEQLAVHVVIEDERQAS